MVARFAGWPYPVEYLQRCATRENWFCLWCRRSYRMRMLARVVTRWAAGSDVYQAGTFAVLTGRRARAPRSITLSEYVEGAERGATVDGVVRQDLHHLTWADASVDLVVTSEIFEHVADPWRAFDEVRRVLRQGGRHIFTVPDVGDAPTRSRAGLPEVLHMDGPGSAGIAVVTDFGLDLSERLRAHGFDTVVHEFPEGAPVTRVFESRAV
jgi:SAM-dependent methyltransferase